MATKIPSLALNNGLSMPVFGLGTWQSEKGEVAAAVKAAIDAGYRHIDGAFVYGNEHEVGEGVKAKIADGTVKREDLFITSKLWNTFHSKNLVVPALKKTLSLLGLDYVDLYLIHWPNGFQEGGELFPKTADDQCAYSDVDYIDTWGGMEECVTSGLAKSIGLSNFNSKQIQRVLDVAKIKPVNNQCECHPYLNQKKLVAFCKSHDITFTAYSPLGAPRRPWAKDDDVRLLDEPKLKEVAAKHSKSPAQILIKYQVQRGVIVIPKSVTESRIKENINIFDFELSADDLAYIDTFDCNGRFLLLEWIKDHPHYPFSEEF